MAGYVAAGGKREATWAQIPELPNPVNFAAATETVTPDLMAEMIPCGPDPERHVAGIRQYVDDLGLLTADRIFDDTAGLQLLP